VRGSVLEDMELAQRVKRAGLRLFAAEAGDLIAVRMYDSWPAIREGLSKNADAGLRYGGARAALVGAGRLAVGWLAIDLTAIAWAAGPLQPSALALGALLVAVGACVSGWVVWRRFGLSPWWGLLLPAGTLAYFVLAAWALARIRWGRGVLWKGRVFTIRR
jgi:chlorobactene glucosyltransferase